MANGLENIKEEISSVEPHKQNVVEDLGQTVEDLEINDDDNAFGSEDGENDVELADEIEENDTGLVQELETDPEGLHPLERDWVMWFMNGSKPKSDPKKGHMNNGWNQGLIELAHFGTIEEFWAIQQHIQIPSKLPLKNDYMMFKEGVRPEWEDEGNLGGGMWKMVIPNKLRAEQLDKMWLETLLSMIGEYYADLGDLICGAYLQRRQREDRIQIWTTKGTEKQIKEIGRIFKQAVNLTDDSQMHYLRHDDQAKSTSWIVKQTGALYKV